jgi:hypothetical protein
MQRVLDFSVDKQKLSKTGDFSGLVAGSQGYLLARFATSSDWLGYIKAAVFTCEQGEFPERVIGGTCKVPDEAAACSSFKVHMVGRKGDTTIKSSRVTVIQRRF